MLRQASAQQSSAPLEVYPSLLPSAQKLSATRNGLSKGMNRPVRLRAPCLICTTFFFWTRTHHHQYIISSDLCRHNPYSWFWRSIKLNSDDDSVLSHCWCLSVVKIMLVVKKSFQLVSTICPFVVSNISTWTTWLPYVLVWDFVLSPTGNLFIWA